MEKSSQLSVISEQLSVNSLKEYLIGLGHKNIKIEAIEPTIEDCFMELSTTQI